MDLTLQLLKSDQCDPNAVFNGSTGYATFPANVGTQVWKTTFSTTNTNEQTLLSSDSDFTLRVFINNGYVNISSGNGTIWITEEVNTNVTVTDGLEHTIEYFNTIYGTYSLFVDGQFISWVDTPLGYPINYIGQNYNGTTKFNGIVYTFGYYIDTVVGIIKKTTWTLDNVDIREPSNEEPENTLKDLVYTGIEWAC